MCDHFRTIICVLFSLFHQVIAFVCFTLPCIALPCFAMPALLGSSVMSASRHTKELREHGGAAQPTVSYSDLAIGFYSVNIKLKNVGGPEWQTIENKLSADIQKAFIEYDLDMLCLNGIGDQAQGIASQLPGRDRVMR